MRSTVLASLALAAALAAAWGEPAFAAAPEPAKPVAASFFSGRWYEIARTRNARQQDCEAPTYDFQPKTASGAIGFVLTCRHGSPTGKAEAMTVSVKLPAGEARNKFKVTALGGLLNQEYWVLDRADDLSWAIMATTGGNYVWLLARKPTLDAATRKAVLAKITAMGYDPAKIVLPRQG